MDEHLRILFIEDQPADVEPACSYLERDGIHPDWRAVDSVQCALLADTLRRARGNESRVVSEIQALVRRLRGETLDIEEIDSVLCAVDDAAHTAIEARFSAGTVHHLTGAVEFLWRCLVLCRGP